MFNDQFVLPAFKPQTNVFQTHDSRQCLDAVQSFTNQDNSDSNLHINYFEVLGNISDNDSDSDSDNEKKKKKIFHFLTLIFLIILIIIIQNLF